MVIVHLATLPELAVTMLSGSGCLQTVYSDETPGQCFSS